MWPFIINTNMLSVANFTVQNSLPENENECYLFEYNDIPKDEAPQETRTIAHRGYSSVAPENTIPAYYAAAENGFTTAECDIEWTKDGIPILLHDNTLNRTAGVPAFWTKLYCENMTYDEILQYDVGKIYGKEYEGTRVPTFYELLDCCKQTGLNLYVEIKNSSLFDEKKAKLLTDAVKEAGLEDKITWISFNSNYLKTIANMMPEARLGYLYQKNVTLETIDTLKSLQTGKNEVFLDIKSSKIDANGDKLLDNAGFKFEAWTIDNISEFDRIQKYECYGITTNSITQEQMDEHNK